MTASRVACVAMTSRDCRRVRPSARSTASSWRRRRTAMDRACPTAPTASTARKALSASGSAATSSTAWTLGGGSMDSTAKRLPALDRRRLRGQPVRYRLGVRARPQGHRGDVELEGVVRAPEEPVKPGGGEPRALVVLVVRSFSGTKPIPVTVMARGTVLPVSLTTEPMPACMSPAVVGASTISSARGRHPPAGERDRYPLARPPGRRCNSRPRPGRTAPRPIRASSTPVTSGSAAAARKTWSTGPKSRPLRPRKVSSWKVWPNRAGLAAASDTPAEKVKAASTPRMPATAPSRAGRTGTAARPRPGSSANRAPTTTGTPNPAVAAAAATRKPRGDGPPVVRGERQRRGGRGSGRHQDEAPAASRGRGSASRR